MGCGCGCNGSGACGMGAVQQHCHCPPGGPVCPCPPWMLAARWDDPTMPYGAPPQGCGEAYANLVQASGGRTPEFPHGQLVPGSGVPSLWCNQTDADAWYSQARHVFGLVRGAWNALMEAENKAQNFDASRAVRDSVTSYETEHGRLKEPSVWMAFGAGGCSQAVADYIANIRNGACQLDLLNQALQRVGASPMPSPYVTPPSPGPFDVTGIAGIGLALLAIFALSQWGRRR